MCSFYKVEYAFSQKSHARYGKNLENLSHNGCHRHPSPAISEVGHAMHHEMPDRSLRASGFCNAPRGMLLDILTGMRNMANDPAIVVAENGFSKRIVGVKSSC